MIDKISTFTIEEKLMVQAILSDYHKNVMSIGVVIGTWNVREFAPNDSNVKALKEYVSYVLDFQIELGVQLAIAGVPEEMRLNAPISKTVFQSMVAEKKAVVRALFVLLGEKLGGFGFFGNQVYMNIWNNKLTR